VTEAAKRSVLHRNEIRVVVVVAAELPQLRGCGLLQRVERQRIRKKLIAPSDQGTRLVAVGDVVVDIDARFDLLELEAIGGGLRPCGEHLRPDHVGPLDIGGHRLTHTHKNHCK